MRRFGMAISALLLVLALTSCNTSDALTPQVDVGGGTSTPVTQADTDRMALSSQPETYSSRTYPQGGGSRATPQNTLEAQAQALQDGSTVSPASSDPPPGGQGQQQAAPQQSASLPPPSSTVGSIRFLPIIGAPVQAVTPLSRQLGAQARASGLTIRASGDNSTDHILKGYFSAFSDSGKVTVVYVWDVLDSAGTRLHRLQGQESVPSSSQDPWAAVPAATMEGIAAKTISEYLNWRRTSA
jgi:hypothetical protein